MPELVAFLAGGQGGDDAVQKVDMSGQVIRSVPFNSADVWRSRDRRMFASEMSRNVRRGSFRDLWIRNDVRVVQEDPEDLLSNVVHFSLPDTIRPRMIYRGDEAWWLGLFRFRRILQIREQKACTVCQTGGTGVGKIGVKDCDDDATGRVLARTFLLLIKEHLKQGGKKC